MAGPLAGVRVLEIGGIGPGPLAAMVLADLGADVLRIDKPRTAWRWPGRSTTCCTAAAARPSWTSVSPAVPR